MQQKTGAMQQKLLELISTLSESERSDATSSVCEVFGWASLSANSHTDVPALTKK